MRKISLTLIILVIFLANCVPSQSSIQQAIEETQAAIPTATYIPTQDPRIAISVYKESIYDLQDELVKVLSSISDRTSGSIFSGMTPDEKDKMRELYNRHEDIAKQMAELPAPPGYENVKNEFQLVYEYTQELVDIEKALLVMTDSNTINKKIGVMEKMFEHSERAFDYLEK